MPTLGIGGAFRIPPVTVRHKRPMINAAMMTPATAMMTIAVRDPCALARKVPNASEGFTSANRSFAAVFSTTMS